MTRCMRTSAAVEEGIGSGRRRRPAPCFEASRPAHQERRQKTGVEIVRQGGCSAPARQIAINAGEDVR